MAFPTPTPTTTLELMLRQASTAATAASAATTSPVWFYTTSFITLTGVTSEHVTVPERTVTLVLPTCIQTAEPDSNGFLPPGSCNAIWNYYPSFSGSLAFMALFGLLALAHTIQAIRFKKGFCWIMVMASVWEVIAYLFRAISSRKQTSPGLYLIYQIFILLSPIWVNVYTNILLARMTYFFVSTRRLLGLPALAVNGLFVGLNAAVAVVQAVGTALIYPTAPPWDKDRGMQVYMGGLVLQLVFILASLAFTTKFHLQMLRRRGAAAVEGGGVGAATTPKPGWLPLVLSIYVSLSCIVVRIIYRLAEFSAGAEGLGSPAVSAEGIFFALEGALMFIAILVLAILHPGPVIRGEGDDMPGLIRSCLGLMRGRRRRRGHERLNQSPEQYGLK